MIFLVFLAMIFFGIVDDFYLQGKLCYLKQKKWWEDNYPDGQYSLDYKCALIIHSFSWSFMVMTPPFLYFHHYLENTANADVAYPVIGTLIIINTFIHYMVDDAKANKLTINLITDQYLHIIQIFFSWILIMNVFSVL